MNNVDNIKQLRENYYTAIKCLQNEKDIIEALPSLEYNSFFPIMTNLIDRLKKEQVDLQSMLQEANEDDMHVYIEEELKMCMLKISVCDRLYQEGLNIQNIEQEFFDNLSGDKNANIVFYDQVLILTKQRKNQ